MPYTFRQGSRDQWVRFFLADERGGQSGHQGITASTEGLHVVYLREGAEKPVEVALNSGDADGEAGTFREIDAEAMPGFYELKLPDAILAEGARRATIMITAPGSAPGIIQIDLVGYDAYDSHALGLDCLSREHRHLTITSAFREVVPDIVKEFRRQVEVD